MPSFDRRQGLTIRPNRVGAWVTAAALVVAPIFAVLQAFGIELTKDQLAAVTGLVGAIGLVFQVGSGNGPSPPAVPPAH